MKKVILFVLVLFISCNHKSNSFEIENYFKFNELKNKNSVNFNIKYDLSLVSEFDIINDSIIFIIENKNDYILKFYDFVNDSMISQTFGVGNGPNEVIQFNFLQYPKFYNNYFYYVNPFISQLNEFIIRSDYSLEINDQKSLSHKGQMFPITNFCFINRNLVTTGFSSTLQDYNYEIIILEKGNKEIQKRISRMDKEESVKPLDFYINYASLIESNNNYIIQSYYHKNEIKIVDINSDYNYTTIQGKEENIRSKKYKYYDDLSITDDNRVFLLREAERVIYEFDIPNRTGEIIKLKDAGNIINTHNNKLYILNINDNNITVYD